MKRIILTDGSGRWFDSAKAQEWDEGRRFDGRNMVSLATGDQFEHEALYRTAGGIYVLHHWSQWQGSVESYEEVSAEEAARWLSVNEHGVSEAEAAGSEVASAFAALELA